MYDLISVIVPIYNVEKYIYECLDSIVNQTYKNLEIILVDDGSLDSSGKICDGYAANDVRIKVIHKENGGVSSARNVALNMATGDWIYFIDPDDWVELNTLELSLDMIKKTNTDMCFFDYENVYEGNTIYRKVFFSNDTIFTDLNNIKTLSMYMFWTGNCNFLVKSSLITNDIRYDEKLNIGEDTIFKFGLYKNIKSFSYIKKALYHYRVRSASATKTLRYDLPQEIYYRYNIIMNEIHHGGYPENAQIIPNTIELINHLPAVVRLAFENKFSVRCNYKVVQNYINTDAYEQAILNYDKNLLGIFASIYVKFKKPNRFIFTFIYFIEKIKNNFISNF